MGSPASKRYPYEDLLAVAQVIPTTHLKASWGRYGVAESDVDDVAAMHGVHPYEAWPELAEVVEFKECGVPSCDEPIGGRKRYCDKQRSECAATDCTEVFHPRNKAQAHCSTRCAKRMQMRRYRATERGAQAVRDVERRYYAECRPYVLKRKRQYYQANKAERLAWQENYRMWRDNQVADQAARLVRALLPDEGDPADAIAKAAVKAFKRKVPRWVDMTVEKLEQGVKA